MRGQEILLARQMEIQTSHFVLPEDQMNFSENRNSQMQPELMDALVISGSATPPPLQAGMFSRGVVTMRCDLSTCSSAHISLLVSGSAETCFDDQVNIIMWAAAKVSYR